MCGYPTLHFQTCYPKPTYSFNWPYKHTAHKFFQNSVSSFENSVFPDQPADQDPHFFIQPLIPH